MIRSSKLIVPLLCVLLLPVLAAACTTAPTPAPTAVPPTPTALQLATAMPATTAPASPATAAAGSELTGASLYQLSCAACHGQDGAGKTFELDGNKISTPSLSWSDLSQMYTDSSRGTVEQQFALAIIKGQDEKGEDLNLMMPRWSSLSQAQVDSLAQYLQTTFK